jgi:hypothetical protein
MSTSLFCLTDEQLVAGCSCNLVGWSGIDVSHLDTLPLWGRESADVLEILYIFNHWIHHLHTNK